MGACCLVRSQRCRGRWRGPAPGWRRSSCWPPRCARPGRSRCRSPWPTCRVSCRSGRSAWAGRPSGTGSAPAQAPTLTLSEVDSGFSAIGAVSGKGSAAARKALVGELFGRATADEQRFLVGLLSGELRQGALEGVMTEAVARAADVPVAEVRRAMMLRGSLGVVAAAALSGGSAALGAFGLEVGRPVRPMLAASAPTIADALDKVGAQGPRDRGGAGVEARRHQDPGAPVRRERPVVHPDPGRHHRPAARGGGGAGASCRCTPRSSTAS